MVRGNKKSHSKNPADWNKFEFVDLKLSKEDVADFKERYEKDATHFLSEVDGMAKNGYKLSLAYDTGNNCIIASFTCREPNDPNFNYVLTARAGDVWEATALVVYKHMYMCDDGDWGGDTQPDRNSWG